METTQETQNLDISDTVAEITNVISMHNFYLLARFNDLVPIFLFSAALNVRHD